MGGSASKQSRPTFASVFGCLDLESSAVQWSNGNETGTAFRQTVRGSSFSARAPVKTFQSMACWVCEFESRSLSSTSLALTAYCVVWPAEMVLTGFFDCFLF